MKFNEAKKIVADLNKVSKEIKEMVDIMGVYAINHYKKSFVNGGFTDTHFEPWKKRKRDRGKDSTRGILIKTRRLSRSLVSKRVGKYSVRISSNVPYALIHNEGGIIKKKDSVRTLNFKITRDGRSRFSKAKKANYQEDFNISAHKIVIPKRQFVGYSYVLMNKIEKKFKYKIRRIFK